jgi:hypothetical protein
VQLPWSYKVDGSLEIVQIDNRKVTHSEMQTIKGSKVQMFKGSSD